MRLFEFAQDDPLRVKVAAIATQLMSRLEDSGGTKPMSVESLLNLFDEEHLSISRDDLIDMIKREPLKNIISKIKGDDVLFKGMTDTDDTEPSKDKTEKTLDKMADRAKDTKR